jgi:hypothetical protein
MLPLLKTQQNIQVMKRITFLLLAVASGSHTNAQGFWVPQSNTINTPKGNVTYTTQQYVHMPMYYGNTQRSYKHDFTIVMKNDSVFTERMAIDISEKQHKFSIKTNSGQRVVRPADTKQVSRLSHSGFRIKGVPADTCWLFLTAKGKINCYSFLAEEGYDYVGAIQQGEEGPLLSFTKANVLALINPQDKAMKDLIDRGKLVKAIIKFNKTP